MPATAKIIKDTVGPEGQRLTTMEVEMHRWVLAEFNTHRLFSRNSASSRAIPVTKQLERVKEDPAKPLAWPCEQPGMQGGSELDEFDRRAAEQFYDFIHEKVWREVEAYVRMNPEPRNRLHKSVVNRFLEPFMWHKVIVSSTAWSNFFQQRCSPLAQPEIRVVAELMQQALIDSTPTELWWGEWHMPYDEDFGELREDQGFTTEDLIAISVARCTRVSYLNHGTGIKDPHEDLRLYQRLVEADPMHASPLEHVATPCRGGLDTGNFQGYQQWRHVVQNSDMTRR